MNKSFYIFLFGTLALCHCHYQYGYRYTGYTTRSHLAWFEVEDPEDCKNGSDDVSYEELPKNVCDDAAAKDRRCFCVGYNYTVTGHDYNESSDKIMFTPICGECIDP